MSRAGTEDCHAAAICKLRGVEAAVGGADGCFYACEGMDKDYGSCGDRYATGMRHMFIHRSAKEIYIRLVQAILQFQ